MASNLCNFQLLIDYNHTKSKIVRWLHRKRAQVINITAGMVLRLKWAYIFMAYFLPILFQTIQTSKKSLDNCLDPPINRTFAKSDTTEITNAGPKNIFIINIIPSILS